MFTFTIYFDEKDIAFHKHKETKHINTTSIKKQKPILEEL